LQSKRKKFDHSRPVRRPRQLLELQLQTTTRDTRLSHHPSHPANCSPSWSIPETSSSSDQKHRDGPFLFDNDHRTNRSASKHRSKRTSAPFSNVVARSRAYSYDRSEDSRSSLLRIFMALNALCMHTVCREAFPHTREGDHRAS
jgi:hypothetical protein